jgi:hypothetical protein
MRKKLARMRKSNDLDKKKKKKKKKNVQSFSLTKDRKYHIVASFTINLRADQYIEWSCHASR